MKPGTQVLNGRLKIDALAITNANISAYYAVIACDPRRVLIAFTTVVGQRLEI